MTTRKTVKIISCALHEDTSGGIILRGVIAPDSLALLRADDYQREVMPQSKIQDLVKALEGAGVPDIVLGMRGYRTRDVDDTYYLQDDVYIIDGLQRISAGRLILQNGGSPSIGAMIHFGTDKAWERARFQVLNSHQTKLSPNVYIRNMRETHPAIGALHTLSKDNSFVLAGRVCWTQRMRRGSDLITARTYIRAAGHLHAHAGPGRHTNNDLLANGLGRIMESVGRNVFRDNVKTFFDIIDSCWGVKVVTYTDSASWLKTNFLTTLGLLFSDHEVFWDGKRLKPSRALVRKLSSFSVHDPTVAQLAGSSTTAAEMLYQLLLSHINSGKRTHRLTQRRSRNGHAQAQPSV